MGSLTSLINYLDRIVRVANALSKCILFLTMLMMVTTVGSRVIGIPIVGIPSLTEILFVCSIYLTIAYVQRTKSNIAVDVFVLRLPKSKQQILAIIQLILPLAFCLLIISASWDFAFDSWQLREATDGEPFHPIYPAKITVALGVTLLLLQIFADLIQEIKSYITKSSERQF